jgi:plastocyanin
MNIKKAFWMTLAVISLTAILAGSACNNTKTVTTTVSGAGSVIVNTNGFQPSMMTARVGTTVTFTNNMGGPMTLVGNSGFMMGSFGGMMMQMGGAYQYTFNSPGTYVVGVSGQGIRCTITVVQ